MALSTRTGVEKMLTITKVVWMAAAAAMISASAALAAPPANVVGTWNVVLQANQTEVLVITNQGGPGAPGATNCRLIIGTIGIAPVRGNYCPASGLFHLLHNNLSTGRTVRDFTGIASEDPVTGDAQIAGTFHVDNAAFGDLGEYPFSATR
jgi:hypothetical protein